MRTFACEVTPRGRLARAEDWCRVHALVCEAMDGQRSQVGYLWALDGSLLYLRCATRPDSARLRGIGIGVVSELAEPAMEPGAELLFRAWVDPTVRRALPRDAERKNQRREPVDGGPWLRTKLAGAADVLEVDGRVRVLRGRRRGSVVTLGQYRATGVLRVTDAEEMRRVLESGIGPAKGYGMGLVLVESAA